MKLEARQSTQEQLSPIEISEKMRQESPVLIVGAPRCGSSLLYRTLQKHSRFKPRNCKEHNGIDFTESKVFDDPYQTYALSRNEQAFSYFLKDEFYYSQFLEQTKSIQDYQRWIIGKYIFHKVCRKLAGTNLIELRRQVWQLTKSDDLIRIFFYYARQARGSQRILEKTPTHILAIQEVKVTFPYAKLLFIFRHPIDTFTSYRRRYEAFVKQGVSPSDRNLRWLKISPKGFANFYENCMSLALKEAQKNPQNFDLIKYEDFVNDPENQLGELFEFLSEPYEDCVPKQKIATNNDKGDPTLFEGIKNNTKNYQDYISEAETKLIEKQLAPLMEKLNYSFYS